jgi:aspartate aminotransferase
MNLKLSSRLEKIQPSATMAVTGRAAEMVRAGIQVTSFGAGEPDFDTPAFIKDAVREAMKSPAVAKYTPVRGTPPLLEAVAKEMSMTHGHTYKPEQVIVSAGAKHCLFNLFFALLNEGDEVIIPAPYWVSYPEMVRMAGGEPVIIDAKPEDNFAPSEKALAKAITKKTRAIVINTPSNPTGAVWTKKELEIIAEVVVKNDLLVIADDIYRHLVYGNAKYVSIASLSEEMGARTILVDGVSKTYAMTGWRIGFTTGPKVLIEAMAKMQGQSTSNATHIAQVAALAALTGDQGCIEPMRKAFAERCEVMVEMLSAMPGVKCRKPQGAFYAFPDLSHYIGSRAPDGTRIADDVALASYLLTCPEGRVALVPGSGFGAPGFMRLSYACSMDDIKQGLTRMKAALATLKT